MSQHDYNIANQSFPSFRSDLNNALSAIQTCNSGTSRPTGAVAGQIWLDTTSATSPTLKYYDGADDISLATIDHVANTVNWLDSTVSVTGLTTTATGTVLTLSDTANTTSVNLIIDNQKEIRFRETTANGTNYIGLKAPASVSADLTFTLPSTDGTSGQFLKTDGAGNLSFASLSFATPLTVIGNSTAGSSIRLPEDTDNGSNYVALKAPDSLSSDLTFTLPSADGTSGQVLQTNGSGVLSFSSVSSDYVLLATTTASSNSAVSFDGYYSSTYKNYKVIISTALPANNAVGFYIRYRRSNADVTASSYGNIVGLFFIQNDGGSGSPGVDYSGYWNSSYAQCTATGGDRVSNVTSNGGFNGTVDIYDPLNTTTYKSIYVNGVYQNSNQAKIFSLSNAAQLKDSTAALSGITFYFESGNIASGTFKLYGIK
jgi:hypothetical protein